MANVLAPVKRTITAVKRSAIHLYQDKRPLLLSIVAAVAVLSFLTWFILSRRKANAPTATTTTPAGAGLIGQFGLLGGITGGSVPTNTGGDGGGGGAIIDPPPPITDLDIAAAIGPQVTHNGALRNVSLQSNPGNLNITTSIVNGKAVFTNPAEGGRSFHYLINTCQFRGSLANLRFPLDFPVSIQVYESGGQDYQWQNASSFRGDSILFFD